MLVRDESISNADLVEQLEKELNELWEQLKTLKTQLKEGVVKLEQYQGQKAAFETRIDDLSKRIYYINKAVQKCPHKRSEFSKKPKH
jgi:septal ring factor EnvC (AmiA/AmiB activator)